MFRRLSMILTAALATGLAASAPPAKACGNVSERMIPVIRLVLKSEALLADGKPEAAAAKLLVAYKDVASYPRDHGLNAQNGLLVDRATFVMALAVVRMGGSVPAAPRFAGKTAEARAKNLAWARAELKKFAGEHSLPRKNAAYAEALASSDEAGDRQRALGLLLQLEEADLMPTAYSHATLARLRRTIGKDKPVWLQGSLQRLHAPRAAIAEARCRKMAKDASICAAGGPQPESS